MFRNIVFFFVCLMIFLGQASYAQSKLTLKNLTVADGLTQGTVNVIMQDSNGFMWLGTENGINIFDGYRVRALKAPNIDLSKYAVYDIRQSKDNLVWFTVFGKGLYSYNPVTDEFRFIIEHDPENKDYQVSSSLEHKPGISEWIITSKTVGLYHHQEQRFEQLVNLSEYLTGFDSIYRVKQFREHLFIATRAGAYVYDINAHTVNRIAITAQTSSPIQRFDLHEANKSYDFAQSGDRLFIGTNDGVFELSMEQLESDFDNIKLKQTLPSIGVWQFYVDNGKLVIAANDGLYHYDMIKDSAVLLVRYSDTFNHVAENSVVSFEKDKNGLYWMGSQATGAYYWNPQSLLVQNFGYSNLENNSLSNGSVHALEEDAKNSELLWVGTANGLNLIDATNNKIDRFLVTDQSKTTFTYGNIYYFEQYNNQIWLATYEGLKLFDKASRRLVPIPLSEEILAWLQQETVVFHLENDNLWFSGEKGSARIHLPSQTFERLTVIEETLGVNNIWNILPSIEQRPNEILYATNDSVWSYHKVTGSLTNLIQFPEKPDSEYFTIDGMVVDKNGTLWVAYSGIGLFGYDVETFEQVHAYSSKNSVIDENVYGVQLDQQGHLWFSTHQGIFRLDINTHHIRQFDIEDGLIANEYNASAVAKLADGRLAYGSMQGISVFDPVKLHSNANSQNIKIRFANIDVLSRELNLPMFLSSNNSVNLRYDDVGIRVDFSTFSFLNADRISYKFELTGSTNIKSPLTSQNYITFPTLNSGKYTLSVWAKSPYTGEFSAPTSIEFNVSYALWRSPLALFLYSFVALSCFVIWLRGRHNRQQELLAAHEEVKYRENRLQLALTGSNSEVWDWFAENNRIFAKRFTGELGYTHSDSSLSMDKHLALIHPEDRELFISKWQVFLMNSTKDESFECSYRLMSNDGQWLWYKDLGKVVANNNDGLPTRVTGSYTNITQNKVDEERAQHYGDAFKQTKDWVFIVDDKLTKITANQSLCNAFGWEQETFAFDFSLLGISQKRLMHYARLLPSLKDVGHWSGEELVKTPCGEEYHVIVTISVSKSGTGNASHYIFVLTDISAQKSAERELRVLANYDHLTGLPNRSLLLERIKHGIDQANRHHAAIALFFIDLDRFKHVNDSLGHDYGDLLLKEITKRLKDTLRQDDTVARIGGDEFVVLLEDFKSNNHLSRIAQKLIDVVEQPFQLNNNVVSVGASIGIALFPDDSKDQDELLRNADVAMYHAKQQGRNNFQFFTEHMNKEAKIRLAQESNLKLAVQNDEFFNLYQPLVDAHTGKAVGAEMLMRWQSRDGIVPPCEFIPLAEELGLIKPMTDMALDKALLVLNVWRSIRPNFYLSINVSAPHFSDGSLMDFIAAKLAKFNLPPNAIKLEVTESAFITEPEKAIKTMQELSNYGCKLALDDFGTGFSSLSYLKNLPLDIIKIDRSFVNGIGVESADEAIVDATLVLAKSLNIACIAEGVETQAQLQYLVDRQCHYIQGYLYYPPLSTNDLTEKLNEDKVEIKAKRNVS
ncbi:EAL domain-containing protein [Thalassotalea sp. M1531]|uniref:EAL domain-containing protein n=1 Tax=Thalassotalea algicola TaxID=2716224 RepID=A0A7Y0LAH3_9GAMM|nr:EAL domain-containing protein [Thalassotalea algicola]NMP30674.1 EAL domain-containing protein [Thalassotalea algicola]